MSRLPRLCAAQLAAGAAAAGAEGAAALAALEARGLRDAAVATAVYDCHYAPYTRRQARPRSSAVAGS